MLFWEVFIISKTILQLKNISAFYGDIQVLWGIDMEVYEGELVALIGSNGAGKSTMLRTIAGIHKNWNGEIYFLDKLLHSAVSKKMVEAGVCLVPEGRQLFPGMTVKENIMMGAFLRKDKPEIQKDFNWILSLFPKLGTIQGRLAGKLSGGEQQMCAIGRGLISKPKLLMIDELSLGLSPMVVETLFEIILKLREQGMTLLVVEQDVHMILDIADRAYCIRNGEMVLNGEAKQILNNKYVKEAFLGIS